MKIAIASDHAGYKMKEYVKELLAGRDNIEVEDFGTDSEESVDYSDFGKPAAQSVADAAAAQEPGRCRAPRWRGARVRVDLGAGVRGDRA